MYFLRFFTQMFLIFATSPRYSVRIQKNKELQEKLDQQIKDLKEELKNGKK